MPLAIERKHMKNSTTTYAASVDVDETSKQVMNRTEDAVNKLTAQFFGDVLLPQLGIEGEIDHIGSTEITYLDLRKYYQDFNYVMKDGSWTHLEFQSTDNGEKDLKRFRAYEAVTSHQNDVDIKTYVLYSGNIENPVTEMKTGFNTYCVKPIIMKGKRAEEIFDSITDKLEQKLPITIEDLVPLTLCPIMGGEIPQKERILKAVRIVKQVPSKIPNVDIIEAVLYAMANKFLNDVDMNAVKEEIKMSPLGTLIYNDGISEGISQGIEKEALENAKNLFMNGVSFQLVRDSIKSLSDETLQRIYDEVIAQKL